MFNVWETRKMKIKRNLMCKCGKLQIEHEDVKELIKIGVLEIED